MRQCRWGWAVLLLCGSFAATAQADGGGTDRETDRAINFDTYQGAVLQAQGHPNELARWHGIWNYDNGRPDEARRHFERAASYGDKLSQHFLTLMHWNGDGVDRDPVLAYVWADLAAERGDNQDLLRVREVVWSALSPEQRERVAAVGPGYYDRYGDSAARIRTNAELRRFMRTQTGSRVGLLTSRLDVNVGKPDFWAGGGRSNYGPLQTSGLTFYADQRTRPDAYWKQEDLDLRTLMKRIGAGTVNVGDVKKVSAPPPDADAGR